jgi:ribosomal protein S18 acetylase RimI-like enzyme
MDDLEFLSNYLKLQTGIMYDQVIDKPYGKISYCAGDKSSFWNSSLITKNINKQDLDDIEAQFKQLERKPAVYFPNIVAFKAAAELLTAHSYAKSYEDSWLFHNGNNLAINNAIVKKVTSNEDVTLFLDIFNRCYQKNDPQNAYGELGDYLTVTKTVWEKHHQTSRIEYFLVYKKDEPVAVSALTNFAGIGYISNVGSLRTVRSEGFGKIATHYCIQQSLSHGNNIHCLATEDGTYADEFYKRIGFKPKLKAICLVKDDS